MIEAQLFREPLSRKVNSSLVRFLHQIMSEFNGFALEFCGPIEFNNVLLFNNIDFDEVGLHINTDQKFNDFFETAGLTAVPNAANELFTFTKLTTVFSKKSEDFRMFNDVVKVYWKGEMTNIVDIYLTLTSAVAAPFYVLGLYDIYFKFSLTVLFYEAETFFVRLANHPEPTEDISQQIYDYGVDKFEKENSLPLEKLPEVFHKFIKLYNSHFNNLLHNFVNIRSIRGPRATNPVVKDKIMGAIKSWGLYVYTEKSKIPKRIDLPQNFRGIRHCLKSRSSSAIKKVVASLRYVPLPKSSSIYKDIFKSTDINYFNALVNDTVDDIVSIHSEFKRFEN